MRSEFLYQYDLPVELLDDIPRTEEVLEVAYARSKEKYLIPILITRERIVWAYPETSTVYRVYEMQYIDLVSVYIRYLSQPLPSTIQFTTVNKQQYTFSSLQGNKQQIRSMLLTLADEVKEKTGTDWIVSQKKTLLYEEFWAGTEEHRGAEVISSGDLRDKAGENQDAADDDFFEDGPLPGKGCFESNEVLFSHFASEGEDVFEEDTPKAAGEDPYAGADDKVARIVETVSAEISQTNAKTKAGSADKKAEDDSVIYGPAENTVPADEQWGENKGGDALILENPPKIKQAPAKWGKLHEYSPEEDDSVLYPPVSAGASAENGKPGVQREYGPEDDDSVVYPAPSDEGVVITPIDKSKIEVTEYKILGEENPQPKQIIPDEVILTPMKKPKQAGRIKKQKTTQSSTDLRKTPSRQTSSGGRTKEETHSFSKTPRR